MCGITGIVDLLDKRPIARQQLQQMTDSLSHRGPDEQGLHLEPGLGFGHRRLSIIDLSSGQQPMHSADGDVVLVYNGELYNFQSLRQQLIALGHQFVTRSDTEVVLQAWREWGVACLARLNGMFALALWQRSTQTLFMARDRLGIKPLYYSVLADGNLVFGSELKALLRCPSLPRRLDARAVEDYFSFGYVPDPKTILQGVNKLPPAHYLCVRRGQQTPSPHSYWDVSFAERAGGSVEAIGQELIERLGHAVESELMADVPLGAFLSGGVDSSAVVAMMARHARAPVNTCSIAFSDQRFDESRFADQVADRYQTAHRRETVDSDAFDLVDRLGAVYDEPFADSSAIPTFRVCQLARKTVKVVLSGDGGDENFAGYRRYRLCAHESRVRGWVPPSVRRPVFGLLGRTYPKLDWAPRALRAKTTFQALAMDDVEGYWHGVTITSAAWRQRLFSGAFRGQLQGYRSLDVFREHVRRAPAQDALSLMQYLDLKTYLPGDILTKVDRASMAHGLEVRVPLLDHEFVDWTSCLPADLKLRHGEGKYIFKKALEPFLPRDVLYRSKMGFSAPLAQWFRGPLRQRLREALLDPASIDAEVFDRRSVAAILDAHQDGTADHAPLLWALMMFGEFQQRVLNGSSARPCAA